MQIESQSQFTRAILLDRLRDEFGDADIGNGTALADALATALALDLRMSGTGVAGERKLAALTEREIGELGSLLAWTYNTKGADFDLPLGTKVVAWHIGDVRFGNETWVLDAGRPGLHPMESTRRDAHGPNLELLHRHITHLTRKLACRQIGLPEPIFIVDTDDRHLLQFPPLATAGGVVLQCWANGTDAPRFCGALPSQILEFAKSIVADMGILWKRRREFGARAARVRAAVEPAAAQHGARVLRLAAADLAHMHEPDRLPLYVHYQAVDEALRDGPVLEFISSFEEPSPDFYHAPYGVTGRREKRERLRLLGADGQITDMAASLATAAPGGPSAVFAELANGYEATFEVPTASTPLYATLFWRDGTIKAEVTMAGKLDYARNQLEISDLVLPETIVASLAGRAVSSFAELPFRCDCVVSDAQTLSPKGVRMTIEDKVSLVDLSSGRMWGSPL